MISLAIPIYNAERMILNNYKALKRRLEDMNQDYEILFGDDGSIDRSKDILEGIARYDHKIRVFSHPNRGLGYTLRQLFEYASGDVIIYLDIDLPFGVESLSQLLETIKYTDVVLASRYKNLNNRIPVQRKITSRFYYFLCKFLFDIPVKDIGSGLVIFRKEVLDSLNLSSCGFDIHIELFTKIRKQGFSIREVPLQYTYNGYTTFSILSHGPSILINTIKLWLRDRQNLFTMQIDGNVYKGRHL